MRYVSKIAKLPVGLYRGYRKLITPLPNYNTFERGAHYIAVVGSHVMTGVGIYLYLSSLF